MVLQSTGVWKYPKNLLIKDNTLSLVLSFRQAKHNYLHKNGRQDIRFDIWRPLLGVGGGFYKLPPL